MATIQLRQILLKVWLLGSLFRFNCSTQAAAPLTFFTRMTGIRFSAVGPTQMALHFQITAILITNLHFHLLLQNWTAVIRWLAIMNQVVRIFQHVSTLNWVMIVSEIASKI